MKKIFVLFLTAFVVILSGCHTAGTGNPKDVLDHFFNALSKKDFETAKKYATKDSEGMISMMQMGMQNTQNDHSDKMLEMINNMKMGDPEISGDKATVPVTDKKSNETTDFLLKKENGDWKVAFDMSTLMEMANKKMQEHGMNNMNEPDSNALKNNIDTTQPRIDSTLPKVPQAPNMPDTSRKH